jgi:hypothetical protein
MRLSSEYNGDQFKPFQNHAKTLLVSSDGPTGSTVTIRPCR